MSYSRQESADAAQWMWCNREQASERWLRESTMIERVHVECLVHDEQQYFKAIAEAQLEGLRALRLYHWQAVLNLRSYATDADMRKSDSKHYNKRADFHLTQVQLLNYFFPIGDTAERDNDNV